MLVARGRPDTNIEEAFGRYEFSVVPRSLFASDGSMLHCSAKSILLGILENLPNECPASISTSNNANDVLATVPVFTVDIVDGMAEVQSLDKQRWIHNCSELADHFNNVLFNKYKESDEVRLIFDRYDVQSSLKTATRLQRQGKEDSIYYRITDSTQISKVPMRRLLSHQKTKMELTEYLGAKALEYASRNCRRFVVSWGCKCKATTQDVNHLQSNHEEADTKLILHAIDAAANGATQINIHSPDTDVFVLSIRRHPQLSKETYFVTGTGQRRRKISLRPIYEALGPNKAAALPAFHAFTGADNTGSFSGKGKLTCWKAFSNVKDEVIQAFIKLGTTEYPDEDTIKGLEEYVCKLYDLKTSITSVTKLRWHLFKKKQAQSDRLPPTYSSLREAILRAHYQSMVWENDNRPNPLLPSPDTYGWIDDEDGCPL